MPFSPWDTYTEQRSHSLNVELQTPWREPTGMAGWCRIHPVIDGVIYSGTQPTTSLRMFASNIKKLRIGKGIGYHKLLLLFEKTSDLFIFYRGSRTKIRNNKNHIRIHRASRDNYKHPPPPALGGAGVFREGWPSRRGGAPVAGPAWLPKARPRQL